MGGSSGRLASTAAALMLALLSAIPARAALFEDDDARKRIDSLRLRIDQLERSVLQRLDSLEAKTAGMVDVLRDVESIKTDLAKLRGQYEVLSYELEQTQKRQRDLYQDLDTRLRKIEGGPGAPGVSEAAPPTGPPPAGGPATGLAPPTGGPATALAPQPTRPGETGAEQRAYDTAFEQFKASNYPAAVSGFQAFVRTYPKSPLAPSALYWAGNAQSAQRDFRGAIATQRQLLSTYPDSQRVPDALLNIANCQFELGEAAPARRTLEEILSKYPKSEAAGKARQRLAGR